MTRCRHCPSRCGTARSVCGKRCIVACRRGALRSRALLRPFHGIRTRKPPVSHDELARAVQPRLRRDQVFSHTTAAAMLGVPLPRRLERGPSSPRHDDRDGPGAARPWHGRAPQPPGTAPCGALRYGSVDVPLRHLRRACPDVDPRRADHRRRCARRVARMVRPSTTCERRWVGTAGCARDQESPRRTGEVRTVPDPQARPGCDWRSPAEGCRSRSGTTTSSWTDSGSRASIWHTRKRGWPSSTKAICTVPIPARSGRTCPAANTSRTSTGGSSGRPQTTSGWPSTSSSCGSGACSRPGRPGDTIPSPRAFEIPQVNIG